MGAAEAYYPAYQAWMSAQIAMGSVQAVWPILEGQLALAKAQGLIQRVIELSLLEAEAWQAQGNAECALTALERALDLAETEGEVLPFMEEGSRLVPLLQAVLSRPSASKGVKTHAYRLLRLMAIGATNQEIAGQLFITVGTVKSHINHILGKLDAHNWTEAVARARELGQLEI